MGRTGGGKNREIVVRSDERSKAVRENASASATRQGGRPDRLRW